MIVIAFMIGLISSNLHHVFFYYAQTMQEQSHALLKCIVIEFLGYRK